MSANEEELEALQDPEIRVMAERSKADEATWNAAMEAFPEVRRRRRRRRRTRDGCRSWVHTRHQWERATSLRLLAPTIDLANHRVESTAKYGVSEDGSHFELTWNRRLRRRPRADTEVFICTAIA